MSLRFGPHLLAAVALLGTAAVVMAVAATPAASAAPAHAVGASQPLDANATIEIRLQANGDARWTVTTWFTLEDDIDRSTYDELATRFEDGSTSDLGLPTFREALADASQQTGREMAIADERRSTATAAEVANGTGSLSLSFTWTNFARVADNGTMTVGDVFRLENGTWFSGLTANQTLVVRPPDGFRVTSSTVPVTDDALRWTGPRSLDADALSATFAGDAPPQQPPTNGLPWLAIVLGVLVLVGAVLTGGYLLGRDVDWGDLAWLGGSASEGTETDEQPDHPPSDAAEPTDDEADVDVELLSDEERVERLLDQNGGRMKQATIVKETGWSNAKVSQLLSAMAEEGRIDKLRIGRENLISYPDEDLTDVDE